MNLTAMVCIFLMLSGVPVPQELHLRSMRSGDGTELDVRITREQAEAVPTWDPEDKQVVPIDLSLAIGLARDSIRDRHPGISEFLVAGIEMSRLHEEYLNRWYYIIRFRPVLEGRPLQGGLYAAFILMDGTVVEPTVAKSD